MNNRWIARVSATMALVTMVSGAALAGQGKKHTKMTAKTPSCSVCHMTLSPKKTKTNTVAVKINGKTYYCCSKCNMKTAKKAGAAKKG